MISLKVDIKYMVYETSVRSKTLKKQNVKMLSTEYCAPNFIQTTIF